MENISRCNDAPLVGMILWESSPIPEFAATDSEIISSPDSSVFLVSALAVVLVTASFTRVHRYNSATAVAPPLFQFQFDYWTFGFSFWEESYNSIKLKTLLEMTRRHKAIIGLVVEKGVEYFQRKARERETIQRETNVREAVRRRFTRAAQRRAARRDAAQLLTRKRRRTDRRLKRRNKGGSRLRTLIIWKKVEGNNDQMQRDLKRKFGA